MLYLASKSPRRRELLTQIHVEFQCLDIDIPEVRKPGEPPEAFVKRMAVEKAQAGLRMVQVQNAFVLGADTIVLLDNQIMGKPKDRNDGLAMLSRLSGRKHKVLSAVALTHALITSVELSISEVEFREINAEERELYWDSGEPADKAGAYGIQGIGAIFIKHLSGSYSGVMGLPLYETGKLLASR